VANIPAAPKPKLDRPNQFELIPWTVCPSPSQVVFWQVRRRLSVAASLRTARASSYSTYHI
jgi:hypothetical protein